MFFRRKRHHVKMPRCNDCKRTKCYFHPKGRCRYGDNCRFCHGHAPKCDRCNRILCQAGEQNDYNHGPSNSLTPLCNGNTVSFCHQSCNTSDDRSEPIICMLCKQQRCESCWRPNGCAYGDPIPSRNWCHPLITCHKCDRPICRNRSDGPHVGVHDCKNNCDKFCHYDEDGRTVCNVNTLLVRYFPTDIKDLIKEYLDYVVCHSCGNGTEIQSTGPKIPTVVNKDAVSMQLYEIPIHDRPTDGKECSNDMAFKVESSRFPEAFPKYVGYKRDNSIPFAEDYKEPNKKKDLDRELKSVLTTEYLNTGLLKYSLVKCSRCDEYIGVSGEPYDVIENMRSYNSMYETTADVEVYQVNCCDEHLVARITYIHPINTLYSFSCYDCNFGLERFKWHKLIATKNGIRMVCNGCFRNKNHPSMAIEIYRDARERYMWW